MGIRFIDYHTMFYILSDCYIIRVDLIIQCRSDFRNKTAANIYIYRDLLCRMVEGG